MSKFSGEEWAQIAPLLLEELRLAEVFENCQNDPKYLLAEMKGYDPTQQEYFEFIMFDPEVPWGWQGPFVDWIMQPKVRKFLVLKARQLGITWLLVAIGLWHLLFRPGSNVIAYSHDLPAAKKLILRAWIMYQSIPEPMRAHMEVLTPYRSELPSELIRLRDRETGELSQFQALPATEKAGHGDTVTFGIMDEAARMDYCRGIYEAVNPGASRGGRIVVNSTANGVSNPETGEGNFYHHLYYTQEEKGLAYQFLPWHHHPERGGPGAPETFPEIRDQRWYEREAMALPESERNRQFPHTAEDAFTLSGDLYFDRESLDFYRKERIIDPIVRGRFIGHTKKRSEFVPNPDGILHIYTMPEPGHRYAIGADSATGKGQDYSVAHVIDLDNSEIVAKVRAKFEAPRYAYQLYWLGRLYNMALICPEKQGGHGEALTIALRDGNAEIPKYTRIYSHKRYDKRGNPTAEDYGHPMGENSRYTLLENLKYALYKRQFPFIDRQTMMELGTFVHREERPSPRAQEGSFDDSVMSLALALEMHRQKGGHPERDLRRAKSAKQEYQPSPVRRYEHV